MNTLAMSLVFGCAGVLLAWLLRRPARRLMGAGPAFCLWLLPPALAAGAWLPAWPVASTHAMIPTLPPLVVTASGPGIVNPAGLDLVQLVFLLWLVGAGVMLARLALHCLRIARRSRPLPDAMRAQLDAELAGFHPRSIRLHPAGPAVCWLPHCHLLLPADFLSRFERGPRAQVLAHERMHLARRDPLWSLLAEVVLAALWFFLPAWLAMSRFHLDQELACDAAIIDRAPHEAGAYARALLSDATTPTALAATTAWLSPSQLKERLTMIRNHSRTLLHRRAGYALLAALLAATSAAAYAAMPATPATGLDPAVAATTAPPVPLLVPPPPPAHTQAAEQSAASKYPASVDLAYKMAHPPRYPPDAVKKHEEGTVVLLILVGTDGHPLLIKAQPTKAAASLVSAAKQAASAWRFTPARHNGKAVESWARVPVVFQIPVRPAKSTHPQRSATSSRGAPAHYSSVN